MAPSFPDLPYCSAVESYPLSFRLRKQAVQGILCWERQPVSRPDGSPGRLLGLSTRTRSAQKYHRYTQRLRSKEFPYHTSKTNGRNCKPYTAGTNPQPGKICSLASRPAFDIIFPCQLGSPVQTK